MNGLSELSGSPLCALPLHISACGIHPPFAFLDSLAGPSLSTSISLGGGSEYAGHQEFPWAARPYQELPLRESIAAEFLATSRILSETRNRQLEAEMDKLKTQYVLRNESTTTQYILNHPAAGAILSNALSALTKFFGEDVVFNLEAVRDDDESISLYAIVVWRGPADHAESALRAFDEQWWLNQPAQPGLTFTYELA